MKECTLINKHCQPCQGGVPPLSKALATQFLAELSKQWHLNAAGHLTAVYKTKHFIGSMAFANAVTIIAEQEGHHPDLTIRYGECAIEIWTHKINGLTENDFILAAKIDAMAGLYSR